MKMLSIVLCTCFLAVLAGVWGGVAEGQQKKVDVLRIGTSGGLTSDSAKDEGAFDTLKAFIKDETGLKNEIVRLKSWRELADKMAKGELHLGVFEGYELAWAEEKHKDLKPLAIALNVYRYPTAFVVAQRDKAAKDFAGLNGQSLALPTTSAPFVRLYLEHQSKTAGKSVETFFSKVTRPDNIEDALDDVVDGVVQVTATDRAALEAYKRRKPARFAKLKDIAYSQPFPPTLVAYYDKVLDQETLQQFRNGLVNASRKEKGQTLLTLFRLTGFEPAPSDLPKVLAETRKLYPPPDDGGK